MLKINIITQHPATIIEVDGEVDLYSSPEVRGVLLKLIDKKAPVIIIDLKNVGYMDSSGVATLVEGWQRMKEYGGKIILASLRKEVRDVFELTKLDNFFEIYDSPEAALNPNGTNGNHQ
jgi:anti-sigma B factor antagonist